MIWLYKIKSCNGKSTRVQFHAFCFKNPSGWPATTGMLTSAQVRKCSAEELTALLGSFRAEEMMLAFERNPEILSVFSIHID